VESEKRKMILLESWVEEDLFKTAEMEEELFFKF
jgi:hypothetical protein